MNEAPTYPLQNLLQSIEDKLGWGPGSGWSSQDFGNLSDNVLAETGVSLSPSTLRRIWGRVKYNHAPSVTTLDALSRFTGQLDWRSYQKAVEQHPADTQEKKEEPAPPQKSSTDKRGGFKIGVVTAVVFVLTITFALVMTAFKRDFRFWSKPSSYQLTARLVSSGLPNSVVFNYVADGADDSVVFQQSWDERTKTAIPANGNRYTSIYYEPGFFQPKLIAGKKTVAETSLLIPSNGWCVYAQRFPVPLYLDSAKVFLDSLIQVSTGYLESQQINSQATAPLIKVMNVGNFGRVPVRQFFFQAHLQNGFSSRTTPCQTTYVMLITDGVPIIIPMSFPGCISNLKLYDGSKEVSGRNNDLSNFGVDLFNWVSVACKGEYDSLYIYLNGQKVYTAPRPSNATEILGYGFIFEGSGRVKNISINNKTLYPNSKD